jgi:glycosyltransferase involved in cell wall biosynthesis
MRILMSMFGWKDSGGGTIFPRQLALELARQGHAVLVIYAAVPQIPGAPAYTVQEHSDQGVQLVGIHNRPAFFLDDQNPEREVSDPFILRIFKHYFENFQPDLVHYHNFLGLSLGIADLAWEAGLPSFYTPYNFWLLCPTLYLNLPNLGLCQGVNASGSNCLNCTQANISGANYLWRRDTLQAHYRERIGICLATSDCVQNLMVENGYAPEQIEILKLGNERAMKIWQEAGEQRKPSVNKRLRIGFTGAVLPIKGVHTLVEAAQYLNGDFEVLIYGEGPPDYLKQLKALDSKGCVNFVGRFEDSEHACLLTQLDLGVVPSVCYDHSPLVIGEFQAARVPVVGANIGGIPDYLQTGTGALYQAGNAAALAAQLQALIDDPTPIPLWQAQMQAPLSFADYIASLEQRYQTALVAGQAIRQKRCLEQFLKNRKPEWLYYDPASLRPLSEAQSGCGIDLLTATALAAVSAETLKQAAWIVLAEAAFKQKLPAGVEAHVLPLTWLAPWPAPVGEIPTDKPLLLLLLLSATNTTWQNWLKAYLQAYTSESPVCLVILPWQIDLDTAQNLLLDWMEAEAIDPETGPELLLLNAEDFQKSEELCGHFQALIWDEALLAGGWLRSQWLRGPVLLTANDANEILTPTGPLEPNQNTPEWLSPLIQVLPESIFAKPNAEHGQELATNLLVLASQQLAFTSAKSLI